MFRNGNTAKQQFLAKYMLDPTKVGMYSGELEVVVVDAMTRCPVPKAKQVLDALGEDQKEFTNEFGAFQVEIRPIAPCMTIEGVIAFLQSKLEYARLFANSIGLDLVLMEVIPEDCLPANIMDAIYPDPRYLEIAAGMSEAQLRAVCRVAAFQLHKGLGSMMHGFKVCEPVASNLAELLEMGDNSEGERRRLFERDIHPGKLIPPWYRATDDLWRQAKRDGFVEDLGRNWAWYRISRYLTLELRCFGIPKDFKQALEWARRFQQIVDVPFVEKPVAEHSAQGIVL